MQNNRIPLEIFKNHLKYKLIKLDDNSKPMIQWLGYYAIWIKFNEGVYENHAPVHNPNIGYSLCLDYDGSSFKWQTSEIKEIINITSSEMEFKTKGSHYKLVID